MQDICRVISNQNNKMCMALNVSITSKAPTIIQTPAILIQLSLCIQIILRD
jgi:hypothetical protein